MWTLAENKIWTNVYEHFGWVRDMRGVPQDRVHHAEGDVETHTRMVCDELQKLNAYQSLDEQSQEILWASALMHDIEKRSTTIHNDDGSISSPGHAKKGAFTARGLIYRNHPAPFAVREAVVKLVRYHGLPLWIFHKPDPVKALLAASLSVNTAWLCQLAEADVRGRACSDKEELLYRIALFRELCSEHDVLGKEKQFISPLAKMHYFGREEASYDYEPFDDTRCEVTLLSGLPGSGKDTYASRNLKGLPVVSIDAIRRANKISPTDTSGNGRAVQMAKEQARVFLRAGTSFVWNATNITRSMREQLIALFLTYKAKVKIVYVEVPYAQLRLQNREREHAVPMPALERMIDKLEVPSQDEAHTVIYQV